MPYERTREFFRIFPWGYGKKTERKRTWASRGVFKYLVEYRVIIRKISTEEILGFLVEGDLFILEIFLLFKRIARGPKEERGKKGCEGRFLGFDDENGGGQEFDFS